MNVNFNNLRKQAIYAYDKLATRLNSSFPIRDDTKEYIDNHGWIDKDTLIIEKEDLRDVMDNLRQLIGAIAMVYNEGQEDFKDVYSEVFPEDQNKRMVIYQDED